MIEYVAVAIAIFLVWVLARSCSPVVAGFWTKANEHPGGNPERPCHTAAAAAAPPQQAAYVSDHDPTQLAAIRTKPKQVNIKGDAMFDDLGAEGGGAIYNGEGAEFRFKNGASAVFIDCLSFDDLGGAVYNRCDFW